MRQYACLTNQCFTNGEYSLTPVQLEDIENIRCWRNAQMDVLRQTTAITSEQQERYYARHIWPQMEESTPSDILFSYFKNNRHIGYGGLVHVSWQHKRAEISFLMDPTYIKKEVEYALDFLKFLSLIKTVAFNDLGLNRIFTETYANRRHHISVLEAAGMIREGIMREHVFIDDHPVDSIIHGYLRCFYEK